MPLLLLLLLAGGAALASSGSDASAPKKKGTGAGRKAADAVRPAQLVVGGLVGLPPPISDAIGRPEREVIAAAGNAAEDALKKIGW